MTDEHHKPAGPSDESPLSELDRFLAKFVELIAQISKEVHDRAEPDEKELAAAFARPLSEQVMRVAEQIKKDARNASKAQLEGVRTLLELTAAHTLADSGMRVAQDLRSQKAKISITDIVNEIKKILHFLEDHMHVHFPEWFWPLMTLIDELLHDLLSIGLLKLKSTLTSRHQEFMTDMTYLTRLQKANAWRTQEDQDESEE